MLTHRFYTTLATLIESGSRQRGPLSIAIGRGRAAWDAAPPMLSRDRSALTAEIMRKTVRPEDMVYLTASGEVSAVPTPRLRTECTFLSGEGQGTLRECGLFMGRGDAAVLLAYFIHPRVDKSLDAILTRRILLNLTPARLSPQEHPTRYLGNAYSEELHDLDNETDACQLDEIRIDRRYFFNTIEEALTLGYDHCAYCFGRDLSNR